MSGRAKDGARQRILVVGGSGGLGTAMVRTLATAGYDVNFTYRSKPEEAEALAAELAAACPGSAIEAHRLDLADRDAVEAFCDTIEDEGFYGYVHNAGQSADALGVMLDRDRSDLAMQVNFWSLTRIAKVVVRGMIRARTGRIVAVGSVAALRGNTGNAAYAATKGAMIAYCRTLAIESAKRGVTVNVLAPGFIDTGMMASYAAYRDRMEGQIPAGRFAAPGEVAALAAFLMSEPAAYITGTVLPIDGGLTAMMGIHRN